MYQLDIKNAFLYGDLLEDIEQPQRYITKEIWSVISMKQSMVGSRVH